MILNYDSKTDYEQVANLYKNSETFGGQYDDARDSEKKLREFSMNKPNGILVALIENKVVGTVTLFEDIGKARRRTIIKCLTYIGKIWIEC